MEREYYINFLMCAAVQGPHYSQGSNAVDALENLHHNQPHVFPHESCSVQVTSDSGLTLQFDIIV